MNHKEPEKLRERIITGSIVETLLKLSYPLIFINLIHVIYNLTDTFWLGKLGRAAVSAPTISWPIIWTIMSLGMGFSVAGFAFISQYAGAGKWDQVKRNIGNLFSILFIFSLIFAILTIIFAPYILKLLGTPKDTYKGALTYLRVMFAGIPFSFGGFAFSFSLRALGDTATPTKINSVGIILNMILDPILILGLGPIPKMGVLGAAIATIFSSTVATLLGFRLIFAGKVGIKFSLHDFKPDWKLFKKYFTVGLPASIGQSLNSFGFVVLMGIVSHFGSVAIAAYGIGQRIINLIFTVSDGISQAMATMVGQNIGAKNFKRTAQIVKKSLLINIVFISVPALVIFLLRNSIYGLFIKDILVIKEGSLFYTYFLISMPFFGIFAIYTQVLRTAGKTKESMALGLVRLWGLRVPLAYFLSIIVGSRGIWIGMSISNIFGAFISYLWYQKGTWKESLVDEHSSSSS